MQSNTIIANSGVLFGTSGARGLVSQFTPDVCAAFAINFAQLVQQGGPVPAISLGIDNRPSSYAMAQACAAALETLGIQSLYFGVLPTPALASYSMAHNMPCIMVTGSHIPFDRNGLKFYRPSGEISKADESLIVEGAHAVPEHPALAELPTHPDASQHYLARFQHYFPAGFLAGKTIGIYQHSSAGRDLYANLFEYFGANTVALGRSDHFVPIDTEAVSEQDRDQAIAWTKQYNLDALFSTDGDGDRPLLADEHGHYFTGDVLGLLCSKYLAIPHIAIPVSCTTALEKSGFFSKVLRTRIGSPYVIAALANLATPCAGFEANGGYLLGSNLPSLTALPTRDAVLPALATLALAAEQPLSSLRRKLPQRFTASDRLQQIERSQSDTVLAHFKATPAALLQALGYAGAEADRMQHQLTLDETDGLRFTLPNQDIVHLRPSGNAPELRCYAESASTEQANVLVQQILSSLKA